MNEEIKAKRDALIEDEAQWCQCKGNICHNCEPIIRHNFAIGFDAGYALAMEECEEKIKDLEKRIILLDLLEEFGVDNWDGFGLAQKALKEFQEKTGVK